LHTQDKMPHFYRYRVEDDLGIESREATTPAATSPAVTRRETAGPVAHVKLLGCEAVIAVPEVGAEINQRNINFLFTQLENTIKDLKDENKQMRQELDKLHERQQPQVLQVTGDTSDNDKVEQVINDRIDALEKRIEEKIKEDKNSIELVSEETKGIVSSFESLAAKQENLSNSIKADIAELANKICTTPASPPPGDTDTSIDTSAGIDLTGQVEELKTKVDSSIATMKSLVFSPLSVIFDAVRSEDWVGEDNYLPFTKLNINLGDGMNIDTGRFSAPISGLYLFILNVYGAPRDAVVLSIRLNELQEVASCSGVGKASQSVIVDMEQNDTVAVFVNDKSKLMDTGNNKFTHFLGVLLRPDMVRF